MSWVGAAITGTHTGSASEAAWNSVAGPLQLVPCQMLRAQVGPSCSSTAPKGAGAGRGESSHLKGTEPAQT